MIIGVDDCHRIQHAIEGRSGDRAAVPDLARDRGGTAHDGEFSRTLAGMEGESRIPL